MVSREMAATVRAALERDTTINLHEQPRLEIRFEDGTVVLQGEVTDVGAKRRIAQRVAGIRGVGSVSDRLRVVPAERRGDGAIRDSLYARLASEPVFRGYTVQVGVPVTGNPPGDHHLILIGANAGTVILNGRVGSLSHRRFADVLAWWTPGVADVENRLLVRPPEDDNDDEITDALRLVFEKDPSVDSSRISITTRQATVRLDGLVHSPEQKRHAELDAWCILGVHAVDNRLEVRTA